MDGPYQLVSVTGVDGLALNVYANDEHADSDISGYPWQGGGNAAWVFDAATGTLFNSFYGTCVSFGGLE